jgi:hypothetical protein
MHIKLSSEAMCHLIYIRNVQGHFLLLTSELSYNCPNFVEGNATTQLPRRPGLHLFGPCQL